MPVTAVGGLMTVARAIDADIEPVPWPGVGGAQSFTPESFTHTALHALELCAADGAPAYVSLVPTQLARVLDDPAATDALARFDHVLIGAAALPTALRHAAVAAGVRLTSTYGASETCGGVVYDGRPLPNVTVTIGTMLTFSFTASLRSRSGLVLSSHTWTDNLDTLLRRSGYIESAIKFHLKSK